MAVLPTADRQRLWGDLMEGLSSRREGVGTLTKTDLRAAVDAMDSWIDANAASFNSAIPLPARTALTAKQKVAIFMAIVKRRWEVT